MISLILAIDPNGLIGRNNDLPWHYPEDLRYFKAVTMGHKVLMGHNTFRAILSRNGKPLPGRENIVVAHAPFIHAGVTVITDLVGFLEAPHPDELFVIGGKTVFEAAWPYADRLYVTHVKKVHEGDLRLERFDLGDFVPVSATDGPELRFAVYERKHTP